MEKDIFKHPRMRFIPPVLWKLLTVLIVISVIYKLITLVL